MKVVLSKLCFGICLAGGTLECAAATTRIYAPSTPVQNRCVRIDELHVALVWVILERAIQAQARCYVMRLEAQVPIFEMPSDFPADLSVMQITVLLDRLKGWCNRLVDVSADRDSCDSSDEDSAPMPALCLYGGSTVQMIYAAIRALEGQRFLAVNRERVAVYHASGQSDVDCAVGAAALREHPGVFGLAFVVYALDCVFKSHEHEPRIGISVAPFNECSIEQVGVLLGIVRGLEYSSLFGKRCQTYVVATLLEAFDQKREQRLRDEQSGGSVLFGHGQLGAGRRMGTVVGGVTIACGLAVAAWKNRRTIIDSARAASSYAVRLFGYGQELPVHVYEGSAEVIVEEQDGLELRDTQL